MGQLSSSFLENMSMNFVIEISMLDGTYVLVLYNNMRCSKRSQFNASYTARFSRIFEDDVQITS